MWEAPREDGQSPVEPRLKIVELALVCRPSLRRQKQEYPDTLLGRLERT